jgi:hypothetical protein
MFNDADYDLLAERFMTGGCHALALKVAEKTGWDMVAVWFHKGRRLEIGHVMVIHPDTEIEDDFDLDQGVFLDIGGVRDLPDILDDLEFDSEEEKVSLLRVDAERIHKLTKERQPHRKLPDLTEELLATADETADRLLAAIGHSPGLRR